MTNERVRVASGVAIIVAASALMPFADNTTPLIPIPIHTFLIYTFFSLGYLVFLPAVYIASYWLWRKRERYALVVLTLATVLAALDAYWLASTWAAGFDRLLEDYARGVSLENGVAFGLVIALAVSGLLWRSRILSEAAHVLIFVVLGWCAFPLFSRF